MSEFKDYSKQCNTVQEAIEHATETHSPSLLTVNGDKLVIITEHAYKYLTKNLDPDEVWDLGFLGESKQHMVKKDNSELFDHIRAQAKKELNND